MRRIGLFTESYDPVINGVSTSVKTLASELRAAGHAPVIVAPRFPGHADIVGVEAAPVLRLPSWRTRFNPQNPFAWPPIGPAPAILREARFDLVHTQQPFGIGMHGRRTARRQGIPLVSTFHTLYHEYAHYVPFVPRRVARFFVTAHLRRYYNSCAAVVVPSHAAGRILENIGVRSALIQVVPTGVPPASPVSPSAVEAARAAYCLPVTAPVLLFVGRLAREKNLGLLVAAFARLCRSFSDTEESRHPILLLVGSGPYQEECRRLVVAAGVDRRVRFTGFLNRGQLGPVYACATLFAFPSPTETQGVVLSEAQSHGLPCVVVDGGGAPEFVRADVDALVVPPTVDAFHAALAALLENEERRRAFAAAALGSTLRPTPGGMALRMIALYETLLASP